MAELIKRAGPPRATDLKGNEFTWAVPLSEAPTREWSRLFSEPPETSAACDPKRLGMMHQAIVFKSAEAHLPVWIQHIDKWIAAANQAMAAQEEDEKRRKAEQVRQEEEKQRRLHQVNEKFKNL